MPAGLGLQGNAQIASEPYAPNFIKNRHYYYERNAIGNHLLAMLGH